MKVFDLCFCIVLTIILSISSLAYANESDEVIIPKDTVLTGKLITPVSSKYNKEGDVILFTLNESYWYKDIEIIPEGTTGKAVVVKSQKAGYFDVGGSIFFEPKSIILKNGAEIPLTFITGKNSSWENDANMAVGVIGIGVFSGFLHGSNQKFPAGTKFKIFVAESINLGTEEAVRKEFNG